MDTNELLFAALTKEQKKELSDMLYAKLLDSVKNLDMQEIVTDYISGSTLVTDLLENAFYEVDPGDVTEALSNVIRTALIDKLS